MHLLESGTLTILGTMAGGSVVATLAYRKLCREMHDLWVWHNKEDDDGVKVWYVRRSLESAITKLAESIDIQSQVLGEIHREQIETRRALRDLKSVS